jgi:hypothetical protein
LIENFDPSIHSRSIADDQERQSQRERDLRTFLLSERARQSPLQVLNEYCQKTKAHLDWNHVTLNEGLFMAIGHFRTVVRELQAEGIGRGKKGAQAEAAALLIRKLTGEFDLIEC